MMNYYDDIKNDILEAIEEDENVKEILYSGNCKDTIIEDLIDYLMDCDYVTGNGRGSYYCNSYKARKQCYNFFRDVFEALKEYRYDEELANFKTFVNLVEEGYIDVENMALKYEVLNEADEYERDYISYIFEEIERLSFKTIDVITRCYLLNEVLTDVVEAILK